MPYMFPGDYQSDFIRELYGRGLIHQCTDLEGLDEWLAGMEGPTDGRRAYIGFDLTADSLHVGSLIQIMMMRWMVRYGIEPVIVLGGATTRIGDPTGKDAMRPMLSATDIATNKRGIKSILERLVHPKSTLGLTIMDNATWFEGVDVLEYLRKYGTHFTVNRMLSLDSVRNRLGRQEPMTFLEFNYMLFQAIDFRHLHKAHNVKIQVGGSDQWGNIVNGVDLVRRMDEEHVWGLTTPLMTNTAGEKMGKTAGGAIWLDPDKTSPFDFWQFWRNVEDAKVYEFLRLFTELGMDVIDHVCGVNGPGIVKAKELLATEVTAMVHGQAVAERVAKGAAEARAGEVTAVVKDGVPVFEVKMSEVIQRKHSVASVLVASGLLPSNNEVVRMAANGGIKVSGSAMMPERVREPFGMTLIGDNFLISVGKKKMVVVQMVAG